MDGGKRDRTRHKSDDEIKGQNGPLNLWRIKAEEIKV